MYAVQLDQLAVVLGVTRGAGPRRHAGLAARPLRRVGQDRPGRPWFWLTRPGCPRAACPTGPSSPALSRLAHLRAVTSVRLALEAARLGMPRRERSGAVSAGCAPAAGGRVGLREHIPDGEVHWPDGAPVSFAGECWAIEAELTPEDGRQDRRHHAGDPQPGPATTAARPGRPRCRVRPARHARVVYLCSAAARPTVARARATLAGAGRPGRDPRPAAGRGHGRPGLAVAGGRAR